MPRPLQANRLPGIIPSHHRAEHPELHPATLTLIHRSSATGTLKTMNINGFDYHRVAGAGVKLNVAVGGSGTPVVLLHGFPQTAACWIRVAQALAAVGYRVLAPDQRGYSPGARPAAVRTYRMPELVADVLALAEAAGAARFHLVGHDWGGAVAWALAGRHPERVATLTSVSTPHPRGLAAALLTGGQLLRSAYIGFFT